MKDFPIVVASLEGSLALELTELTGIDRVRNRDAKGYYFRVRHGPGEDASRLGVLFSGTTYDIRDEHLSIPVLADRQTTFAAAAVAAIGDYLDEEGMPPIAEAGQAAPPIECFSPRFITWRDRAPAPDDLVESYLRNHLYWAWRFSHSQWTLDPADTIRLAQPLAELDRLIRVGEGEEWEVLGRDETGIVLKPTQGLIRSEREARAAPKPTEETILNVMEPTTRADESEVPVHPYVDEVRIADLKRCEGVSYDLSKLIALCEELNQCWRSQCYHAVAALNRAVMDHIPPLLGCGSFTEVANNYNGGRSFKGCMQRLESAARKIGDSHLHTAIRERESLPTRTQVNFSNEVDMLLAEIVRASCETEES